MAQIASLRRHGILIGLVVLCVGFGFFNPVFLSAGNLSNILLQSTPVTIAAIGMTFVILAGGIDLSVGSIVALSGIVFGLSMRSGMPLTIGVALCLFTGLACGGVNGIVVTKARVPSFIATLGMMSAARGISLMLTEGRSISDFPHTLLAFANGSLLGVPYPPLLLTLLIALGHFFLEHTVWGRNIYAIGGNANAAWLCGVKVPEITTLV